MRCPLFAPSLVITEDAQLAAQLSCALAVSGHYLPVLEGPRLTAPINRNGSEVARQNNAASRAGAASIILAGLPDESVTAIREGFQDPLRARLKIIANLAEATMLMKGAPVR